MSSIIPGSTPQWRADVYFERPCVVGGDNEVHLYTNAISYARGETVEFHASTNAASWGFQVIREGVVPQVVFQQDDIKGQLYETPADCYAKGCGWPVASQWTIPTDTESGFYVVRYRCLQETGEEYVRHHFFVVRPERADPSRLLMILPTCTWLAYNDWGGANHYRGVAGETGDQASPILSLLRPWARGLVWLPDDAPRVTSLNLDESELKPRYLTKEWAYSNGYCFYYGSAGWAQFDRNFYLWALSEGYDVDVITQHDIKICADLITSYRCVAVVGHDEYWSSEMRDVVESYISNGGRVARFAGNYLWQVRLEDDGLTQICYKTKALAEDPVANTEQHHLLTTAWEDREINRPGASIFGVNALRGMYAGWGGFSPHGSGGLTVYRPGHWSFDQTGLRYGDLLGAKAGIFSYEVDGLDYTFRHGLPYPTGADGVCVDTTVILALSPASVAEDEIDDAFYYVGDSDLRIKTQALEGTITQELMERHRYGCGVVVHMTKGRGEVYCAGVSEWVVGLATGDVQVQRITRTVLNRFMDLA